MEKTAQNIGYKNLIVYQKAKKLAVDIIKYFSGVKIPKVQEFIVNQLVRSVCSIGANIAEGYGRLYKRNYRQFVSISRGSSFETDYWLEILLETDTSKNAILKAFSERNLELIKMLTTMMIRLDNKQS